jgi:protein-tyrosine-phosphatase
MSETEPGDRNVAVTTYNVLFVCSGNTCRSPMAEVIARHEFETRGWSHVAVQSAGTGAASGAPASEQAIAVAAAAGLDLSGHASQPLTEDLLAWADIVLAMGSSHLAVVGEMGGGGKAVLATYFMDDDDADLPVHDPFGGDTATYQATFEQLEAAIAALARRLEPILAP